MLKTKLNHKLRYYVRVIACKLCSFVFALLNAAMLLGVETEHEYPNNSETGTFRCVRVCSMRLNVSFAFR